MLFCGGDIHEEEDRVVIHNIHEGGGRVGMLQMVVEDVHDAVEVDQQQKEVVDSVENDVAVDSLDDDGILGTDNDVEGVHYDRHTSSPRVVVPLYPQHFWELSPWDYVYQVSVVDY